MPSRHRSRQKALQILFLWDTRQQSAEESISAFYDSLASDESGQPTEVDNFTNELTRGTINEAPEIDKRIKEHSAHWRLDRMPAVDRSILRLATYEMMQHSTPHAVVIDESLELARRFSSEESISFINGVLDAVSQGLAVKSDSVSPEKCEAGEQDELEQPGFEE